MKVYIAGPLCNKEERIFSEKIDKICKNLGFGTFLPHRDAGLYSDEKSKFIREIYVLEKE